MVTKSEVKTTIAVAIGGAFGFIIALIWRDIIIGLMTLAGFWQDGGFQDLTGAAVAIVGAIIITIICVFGILYISKWGGVEKK
jgi:hypothetical protein